MDTVRDGQFGLSNTNKLVRFYDGTTGLKTGYTAAAGHCLSASAKRDGMELIAVVLHCGSSTERFQSAKALLDYGFANYALVTPDPENALPELPVRLGEREGLTPVLQDPTPVLIDKELRASVTRTLELPEELEAPVAEGQILGKLTLSADGTVLKQIPLAAPEEVPRLGYWQILLRVLRGVCLG